MLETFSGYDPAKRYIQSSSLGTCMGPKHYGAIYHIDPDAPIYSGDHVQIFACDYGGSRHSFIKRLEAARDGRWFIVCNDGVAPIGIGTLFRPDDVRKIVAIDFNESRPTQSPMIAGAADENAKRIYAEYRY